MGFEPKIPVFQWAKTFNALDGAATVIGKTGQNSVHRQINATEAASTK
jgi:hypothetical protein